MKNFAQTLHLLIKKYGLTQEQVKKLLAIENNHENITIPMGKVRTWTAILASVLFGLGVIFWISANWAVMTRYQQFALLQGVILVACLGVFAKKSSSVAFSILAFLGIGGLLAYFGQTYQTGGDPWQLFAIWAVFSFPMCLGLKNDVLWSLWVLVVMIAIRLWSYVLSGQGWFLTMTLPHVLLICCLAMAVGLVTCPIGAKRLVQGRWPMRIWVVLMLALVMPAAIYGLLSSVSQTIYFVVLPLCIFLFVIAYILRDVFSLCCLALALIVLLTGMLVNMFFFHFMTNHWVVYMFGIGIFIILLLTFFTKIILKIHAKSNTGSKESFL